MSNVTRNSADARPDDRSTHPARRVLRDLLAGRLDDRQPRRRPRGITFAEGAQHILDVLDGAPAVPLPSNRPPPRVEERAQHVDVLATLPRDHGYALRVSRWRLHGHPYLELRLLDRGRPTDRSVTVRMSEIDAVCDALRRGSQTEEAA